MELPSVVFVNSHKAWEIKSIHILTLIFVFILSISLESALRGIKNDFPSMPITSLIPQVVFNNKVSYISMYVFDATNLHIC